MKKRKNLNKKDMTAPAEAAGTNTEIRIQKADMKARTSYDYRRLEQRHSLLIPCSVEEEKETLYIKFNTEGMQPFETLRGESRLRKIEVLLQAAELKNLWTGFEFSMHPDNLYYDRLGRVKVARRDIADANDPGREERFLKMYRALAGYILEGSRSYEDYLSGGAEILKNREEFVRLMEAETFEAEKSYLIGLYETTLAKEKQTTQRVGRRKYRTLVVYSIISAVLLAGLAAACIYSFAWYIPRQDKMAAANDAYLQRDYIAVIDSLRDFDIDDMGRAQKYILATAYIQGQSVDTFSTEDKEAILSKITYQANETVLDYWISLGRLDVSQAQELAMQMSDDQLLLYAYMQELDQIDADREMAGEEKASRKEELMQEIETLADRLGISYGTDSQSGTENAAETGSGPNAGINDGTGAAADDVNTAGAGALLD